MQTDFKCICFCTIMNTKNSKNLKLTFLEKISEKKHKIKQKKNNRSKKIIMEKRKLKHRTGLKTVVTFTCLLEALQINYKLKRT